MKINYKIQGTPNSPVLVFSNSLGSEMMMWDELVPYLLPFFRVVQYDTRGHGKSEITKDAYNIQLLGEDMIALMNTLEVDKFSFCGLSMGGLIGQWLGIHHSDRLNKLILSNTAAKIGTNDGWNARIETISKHGMNQIADAVIKGWFTDNFSQTNPGRLSEIKAMFLRNDVLGYSNCCTAVRDADFSEELGKISTETLVIAGSEDASTTISDGEFLVNHIPNARLKILQAKHVSSTEFPAAFAKLLIDFIAGETTFERGMHVRRTVLGDEHVNKSIEKLNDFNADFQYFISNYAWGEIWTRHELSKHNRSLITIAMLIALNRKAELQMHIKAAFNNGVTVTEIKEVIMHSALYCGLPAANEAIHTAEQIIKELNNEGVKE